MNCEELVAEGRAALQRGDWPAARAALQAAADQRPDAEALEALATACWWQDDESAVLEIRERAYRLYREQGDARSAARLATLLGVDYFDYRSDFAVSSGWLRHAETLLKDIPLSPEHGWLHVYQGYVALMFDNDPAEARGHVQSLAEMAPILRNVDIETMSLALEGLIAIREGRTNEGMRHLDEAMTAAIGGDMTDLPAIGNTCCTLIYACEAVADYDRAAQWCERTREFCKRLGLSTFFAICRNYYATVLMWRGAWDEADIELSAALHELQRTRPGYALDSLAKLGELRRRQGRLQEARELFARAEPHRTAIFGQAALALDRGDPEGAIGLLERVLRRVGEEDQAERAFILDLLVRARIAAHDIAQAETEVEEIIAVGTTVGTRALHAVAQGARGMICAAKGDYRLARQHFEDAIDLFDGTGAEFESACLRLDYARVLDQLQRPADAVEQAMTAQSVFSRLGAALYVEKAALLASHLTGDLGKPPVESLPHGLTSREAEVLWQIAAGKTNQQIAADLVLSIRTVERHISTIYEKLDLHGRAARASAAAFAVSLRPHT